ncbi:MAG TPA: DUF4157 domain-containing protein [Bacteroidia bacterium]|nr:DUF4157 domain-containing protein [Bacteroidia bacterium]
MEKIKSHPMKDVLQQRTQAPQENAENQRTEGFGLTAEGPDGEAALQRQAAANASPQVGQLRSLQAAVNGSPQVQQFRKQQAAANTVQRKENKTGMPDQLKSGMESLAGMSLDDVKVHYNSDKPAEMQAHAFAQGSDVHIAPGQEQHLAHEAWHVVQQKQGRVQATSQLKGIGVNDDSGLEHEADVMGAKALQTKGDAALTAPSQMKFAGGHANGCSCGSCSGTTQRMAVVQRVKLTKNDVTYWQNLIEDEADSGKYDQNQIKQLRNLYEMVDTDAQVNDVQNAYNQIVGVSNHPSGYAYGNGTLFKQYHDIRTKFFPSSYDYIASKNRDTIVKIWTDPTDNDIWQCPSCMEVCDKNTWGEDVTIDHKTDCATYWNSTGYNNSKQDRINFYNDINNHEICCRSCNSSKNSGGSSR